MTFCVAIMYRDKPFTSYTANFLPRVGDTVVDDMDVMYIVTEVRYCIPKNDDKYITALVYVE